ESLQQSELAQSLDINIIPKFLNSVFGIIGATLIAVFSIIFISFFLLKDSKLMLNSILVFANKGEEDKFQRVFNKIKILLSRYFRSEEHTSELQSRENLVCRLMLEKKKSNKATSYFNKKIK